MERWRKERTGKERREEEAHSVIEKDNMRLLTQSWQQGPNILDELVLRAASAQGPSSGILGRKKPVSRRKGSHVELDKRLSRGCGRL